MGRQDPKTAITYHEHRRGLNQPKVSALRNYKLEGFSVERLMTLLNALDQDIEIVIRKKPRASAWWRRDGSGGGGVRV